jgi:hypothetical protein
MPRTTTTANPFDSKTILDGVRRRVEPRARLSHRLYQTLR